MGSDDRSPTHTEADDRSFAFESDDASVTSVSSTAVAATTGLRGTGIRLSHRLLHALGDFRALEETYDHAAAELAAAALRLSFSSFLTFVSTKGELLDTESPADKSHLADVERAGREFSASLRSDLDAVVAAIRRFVVHHANAQSIIKLAFTELVVANTRFHGLVSAMVGRSTQSSLRGVVVTTPQLLGLMKEASSSR